jgi:hypothetical protein
MKKHLLIIFFATLLAGCTKEIFITEEPETPVIILPGEFSISVENITDTEAVVSWTAATSSDNKSFFYDIAVNDSTIAYDLSHNLSLTVSGLYPNTKYAISVIAHDADYNLIKKDAEITTMKSFFQSWHPFNLEYDQISIYGSSETSDGGYVICGIATPYDAHYNYKFNFVSKINHDFTVAWIKIFDWDFHGINMSAIECSDGNLLTVWTNTVMKLNPSGEIIWTYECPSGYGIEFFSSVTENQNHEILLLGYKVATPVKYSVIKLNQSGGELWHKWGGSGSGNWMDKIITESNGDILLLGTTEGESLDDIGQNVFKIIRLDENGDLVNQYVYPNKYFGSDVVYSLQPESDGSYLMVGSSYAYIGGIGTDWIPHIIKINHNGEVIWEKFIYAQSTGEGIFRILNSFLLTDSNEYLILIKDDKAFSIAFMNKSGDIINYKKIRGYPLSGRIFINQSGNFVYLTNHGFFVFDPEGYVPVSYY